MKLSDKTALVTGGGSGIGRAIATRFGQEGARVIVNDLRLDLAQETVAAMGPTQVGAHAIQADVSDSPQVQAMFAEIDRRFGTLDVLVNNAGVPASAGVWESVNRKFEARLDEMEKGGRIQTHWEITQEMSDAEWHRMMGVHLNGTFFCTREALKLMSRRNSGVIVNMASVAALAGLDFSPHYSAAKGGILSFTRAVAREVGSQNIRVNAICPGFTNTQFNEPLSAKLTATLLARTPLARPAEAHEVATTALFLACDDSAFFTGQWLSPNGGGFMG
jgi:3-oxoacyl-[acyl-carrier protein] reductase